jgi:hypothetical protein
MSARVRRAAEASDLLTGSFDCQKFAHECRALVG